MPIYEEKEISSMNKKFKFMIEKLLELPFFNLSKHLTWSVSLPIILS